MIGSGVILTTQNSVTVLSANQVASMSDSTTVKSLDNLEIKTQVIGSSDIDIKDVNPIFKLGINFSNEYIEIVEQSTKLKQQFSICNNGLFINILGDELSLFKVKIS